MWAPLPCCHHPISHKLLHSSPLTPHDFPWLQSTTKPYPTTKTDLQTSNVTHHPKLQFFTHAQVLNCHPADAHDTCHRYCLPFLGNQWPSPQGMGSPSVVHHLTPLIHTLCTARRSFVHMCTPCVHPDKQLYNLSEVCTCQYDWLLLYVCIVFLRNIFWLWKAGMLCLAWEIPMLVSSHSP